MSLEWTLALGEKFHLFPNQPIENPGLQSFLPDTFSQSHCVNSLASRGSTGPIMVEITNGTYPALSVAANILSSRGGAGPIDGRDYRRNIPRGKRCGGYSS